ncbi:MAG: cyclase family protein [Planctomycetota bacterium]
MTHSQSDQAGDASSPKSSAPKRSQPHRGLLIGAGYFSDFHLDAWRRMPSAEIVCVCDLDQQRARESAARHGVPDSCQDVNEALARDDIDFIDIATGPTERLELVRAVLRQNLPVICQKPLANDFATAKQIIDLATQRNNVFMVHENFRFQPWHREIKRLIAEGVVGQRIHQINMRTRLGDGWGEDAYLSRQPYFRTMPRLLIHETGIHFIDTFRYLLGDVERCSARLHRHNDQIAGEDAGTLTLEFAGGATAIWDANRFNESTADDPRYTFGEMTVEGSGGTLRLDHDGTIRIQPLGEAESVHQYTKSHEGFAGDCVLACQQHFIDVIEGRTTCETAPDEYVKSLRVVEAAYESSRSGHPVNMRNFMADNGGVATSSSRRVIDLSLPINESLPNASIEPCKTIAADGWNATTIQLYSHCGTHMDAPKHFIDDAATLEQQTLSTCIGPARLVDLPDTPPSHAITVNDVHNAIGAVHEGDRLLFRTGWSERFGTPAYRDQLPRISLSLAEWLVQHKVALIGVEPPSVANVLDIAELTEVHQTLFRGGVVIVEGLTNLDQIQTNDFEFVALPLRIEGGDGCPVRAVAIVDESEAS